MAVSGSTVSPGRTSLTAQGPVHPCSPAVQPAHWYQYGAGLMAINGNGEGHMTDSNSFGARLDYAVAANLNVYGTFFYADRVSGGWPWGILTLQADGNGTGRVILLGQSQTPGEGLSALLNAPQNQGPNFAPNIPDNSLGWEINVGADWKLLEGLTLRMRGAYWNVGNWFKFACIDKGVANTWNVPLALAVPVLVMVRRSDRVGVSIPPRASTRSGCSRA